MATCGNYEISMYKFAFRDCCFDDELRCSIGLFVVALEISAK